MKLSNDSGNGLVDSSTQSDWVGSSCNVAQTLANKCLSENGCGCGSVTSDIVGLLGNFFYQLCADALEWVFEFDLFSNRNTIVGDGRCAPLLF